MYAGPIISRHVKINMVNGIFLQTMIFISFNLILFRKIVFQIYKCCYINVKSFKNMQSKY